MALRIEDISAGDLVALLVDYTGIPVIIEYKTVTTQPSYREIDFKVLGVSVTSRLLVEVTNPHMVSNPADIYQTTMQLDLCKFIGGPKVDPNTLRGLDAWMVTVDAVIRKRSPFSGATLPPPPPEVSMCQAPQTPPAAVIAETYVAVMQCHGKPVVIEYPKTMDPQGS